MAKVERAAWRMRPLPLPHVLGVDAAGVVDEVGRGVSGVRVGDEVVDYGSAGGANAEYAVLVASAGKPALWSWEQAGGAAGNVETATRVLDRLGVGDGMTLLVEGAAGGVGTTVVQLAVAGGAKVVGTASPGNHEFLASLGATATTYGPGLAARVGAVDVVLDCAGSGSLPGLVALAGDPGRVVSVADLRAGEYRVHLSRGSGQGADAPSFGGLAVAAELAGQGRFPVPIAAVFPLEQAAAAHELIESRHARGKVVLTL